jgi:hypothetical protein
MRAVAWQASAKDVGCLHMAAPETTMQEDEPRYVLITECLQNDFVLNAQCRLAKTRNQRRVRSD